MRSTEDERRSSDADAAVDERSETTADAAGTEGAVARRFPIVGLGASAGGLGALEAFFSHMPADSGLAFVVVTHQHAGQPSLMAELLGRKTAMPVVQISRATPVEPDHVYTVRPGYHVAVLNGVLQPMEIDPSTQRSMPIDYFFRSLARDQADQAIAIVLSGTGSDGSVGLKEVKGELGMVMVQEEASAQYSGMPHSAIVTGMVDYVLPAAEMPARLIAYVRGWVGHRHSTPEGLFRAGARGPGAPDGVEPAVDALQQIFVLVRDHKKHDFSQYKRSTLGRRIARRMSVLGLDTVKRYVRYLQATPREIDVLFKELLIGVTSFFRDPEVWAALGAALSEQLANKPDDYVVRAWVAGCSTGEEAYSLAILLRECMDRLPRALPVQVFATDLDADAIEAARAGVYPLGIASDLSAARLARFFSQHDDSYRVRKEVREMVVFAPQNLIADPPFTKLDLLSCRNLLIYLDGGLQKRLVPIFHYSLKPDGLLLLGSSESLGSFFELFSTVDKRSKLFRRNEIAAGVHVAEFPASTTRLRTTPLRASPSRTTASGLDKAIAKMLLAELVPPTVIVDERGDVVHVHGRTGLFLEPSQGSQARANIGNMARDGLRVSLAAAIRQAATSSDDVVMRGIRVRCNGAFISVDLRVVRLQRPEALRGMLRVTFDAREPAPETDGATRGDDQVAGDASVLDLERELQHAKESHQATIEELEAANEELKSTNEELQSTNEELQSANEELETSKEEMQSLNEELQTVNAELQDKLDDLSRANNDMKNLLNGTDIATVFLDNELRIKRFTEQAQRVIRLIPSDLGRPIGDLVSTLVYDRLVDDASEVLRTLASKESEVEGQRGETYLMRILPYRTTDNVIDGVVLTFVDITAVRQLQGEQRHLVEALARSPVNLFEQDRDLRISWAMGHIQGRSPRDLVGLRDVDLFESHQAQQLGDVKRAVMATATPHRLRIDISVGGEQRTYDFYIEPTKAPGGDVAGVSCVAIDVTSAVVAEGGG